MIKSAAENIYPVEVEQCLAAHDAVAECAVIGVPDERWVQSVKAIVVLAGRRERRRPTSSSSTAGRASRRTRSRASSSSSTRSPATGCVVDYDALDERFGGGNYPGGRRSADAHRAGSSALPRRSYRRRLRMVVRSTPAASSRAGSRTTSTTSRCALRARRRRVVTEVDGRRDPLAVDDVSRTRPVRSARSTGMELSARPPRRRRRRRPAAELHPHVRPRRALRRARGAGRSGRHGAPVRHRDPGAPRRPAARRS